MTAALTLVRDQSPSFDAFETTLLTCWDEGLSTYEIARLTQQHEHDIERRLWRLREQRRNGGAGA
jgi:hypothetical protein